MKWFIQVLDVLNLSKAVKGQIKINQDICTPKQFYVKRTTEEIYYLNYFSSWVT